MDAQIWSEDLPFPEICSYCGQGCYCNSSVGVSDPADIFEGEEPSTCDYCDYGCQCGAEDWEPDEDEDDDDDEPDCECDCECCTCECECENLVVEAASFNEWTIDFCRLYDLECVASLPIIPENEEKIVCKEELGNGFSFLVRAMPTSANRLVSMGLFGLPRLVKVRSTLAIYSGREKRSHVEFDGPVLVPMLRGPTPGNGVEPFWMSLTPMEVFSLREGIAFARGRVLVAGLGMGWMTQRILEKSGVSHVTQAEMSPEVIDFSGKPLQRMFPGKIDFVLGDVWNYLSETDLNQFDTIIFDIWPQYGSAGTDDQFQQLKLSHPNVWGWGDV